MVMMISIPRVDTSSTFKPFSYTGLDKREWSINNLHDLRRVEKAYQATGHNIRFDAYSSDQNNPNDVDGFGAPYNPRDENVSTPAPKIHSKQSNK